MSFHLEQRDAVAVLVLDRPDEHNTLLPRFWSDLRDTVEDLDRSGSTRALVIASTGRHFSAGLDRSVLGSGMFGDDRVTEPGRRRAVVYAGIRELHAAYDALASARFPVIAAIQGGCVGGALGLVAACDLRWATPDAFFLLQETNLGITADVGQLQRLPRLLPEGVVRELAFSGTRLDGVRAERLGFVNALVADADGLRTAAVDFAQEVASRSPLAVWGCKRAIEHARTHSVADGLEHAALWQAAHYHRTDAVESMRAREEGRAPEYDDLPPLP